MAEIGSCSDAENHHFELFSPLFSFIFPIFFCCDVPRYSPIRTYPASTFNILALFPSFPSPSSSSSTTICVSCAVLRVLTLTVTSFSSPVPRASSHGSHPAIGQSPSISPCGMPRLGLLRSLPMISLVAIDAMFVVAFDASCVPKYPCPFLWLAAMSSPASRPQDCADPLPPPSPFFSL